MPPSPQPLYYTFANHMHWVDMQWLWGYHVLPGSVRDMLHLIRETGARGGVNFDALGYEKMAAECPDALAELRDAVVAGLVEPVGCSYGQPYGLFQGLESNIRQFTYGVRATRRLLGVRPRTFWEEEFYFFPQLPQILRQCGYTGASLFFQWTWHTPEVPREPHSLILWQGADGTTIPTLPRNDLNVHQWPEDFDGLLEGPGVHAREPSWGSPAIAQWLELMPSRDWMCRSEVLLPRLKELLADERFDVRARTPGALIAELAEQASAGGTGVPPVQQASPGAPPLLSALPRRHYTMDDVWHGMTLGKNADRHPRACAEADRAIREAECAAAVASLLGRPYASWDVYPTWELDEAWRNLLAAQHHDNHECEGLCGFIGHGQIATAMQLAEEVMGRASWLLRERTGQKLLQFNSAGWTRTIACDLGGLGYQEAVTAPAFGYAAREPTREKLPRPRAVRRGGRYRLIGAHIEVEVDAASGAIVGITGASPHIARAPALGPEAKLFTFAAAGRPAGAGPQIEVIDKERLYIRHDLGPLGAVTVIVAIAASGDAVDLDVHLGDIDGERLQPGFGGALLADINPGFVPQLHAATAGEASAVQPSGTFRRKYPSGDWMTAPQWFEEVESPFCSLGLVDLVNPATGSGLLVLHEGCQQWRLQEGGAALVMTARDPWDEGRYDVGEYYSKQFRLALHGPVTGAERMRIARAFLADHRPKVHRMNASARPVGGGTGEGVARDLPPFFGPLSLENAPGVLAEAFYRESMYAGEHLPEWAGHRMFADSGGACDHPFVIRLVEYSGEPAEVTLKLAGDVAMAAKTNLMGEVPANRNYDPAAGYPHRPGESGYPHRPGGLGPEESPGWSEADCGWLTIEHDVAPPDWAITGGKPIEIAGAPLRWSQVRFRMRPREIATIMCDMVMGRKQWRDLDARREVWATIHKRPSGA